MSEITLTVYSLFKVINSVIVHSHSREGFPWRHLIFKPENQKARAGSPPKSARLFSALLPWCRPCHLELFLLLAVFLLASHQLQPHPYPVSPIRCPGFLCGVSSSLFGNSLVIHLPVTDSLRQRYPVLRRSQPTNRPRQ